MAHRQKDDNVKDKKKGDGPDVKRRQPGTEPKRTPGQAEGRRASRGTLREVEPGRTPGQAEGTEEDVEANLKQQKNDLKKK